MFFEENSKELSSVDSVAAVINYVQKEFGKLLDKRYEEDRTYHEGLVEGLKVRLLELLASNIENTLSLYKREREAWESERFKLGKLQSIQKIGESVQKIMKKSLENVL